MENQHRPYGLYEKYIKRPQDFLCALLALIVLSPVMLITAILVREATRQFISEQELI